MRAVNLFLTSNHISTISSADDLIGPRDFLKKNKGRFRSVVGPGRFLCRSAVVPVWEIFVWFLGGLLCAFGLYMIYLESLLFSLCFSCVFSFFFSRIVESNVVVVFSVF